MQCAIEIVFYWAIQTKRKRRKKETQKKYEKKHTFIQHQYDLDAKAAQILLGEGAKQLHVLEQCTVAQNLHHLHS